MLEAEPSLDGYARQGMLFPEQVMAFNALKELKHV